MFVVVTPEELKKLGETLGKRWITKLAKLMPCSARTVHYWLNGERKIQPMVANRIRQVIKEYGKK